MTTWDAACGTGHRSKHLDHATVPWIQEQAARVAVKLRDEHGTHVGISGMAECWDLIWAEAIVAAGMELWAYVPFPQQADRWPAETKAQRQRLLDQAAKVRVFGDHFSVRLLHARNDGMLADSRAVVACWRPSKTEGGTASAVKKARRRGLPIVHINPDALSVTLCPPRAAPTSPERLPAAPNFALEG